jgi:hypothetical protein
MPADKVLWHRDADAAKSCLNNGNHGGDKGVSGSRGSVMPSGLHHAAWVCRYVIFAVSCA